MKRLSIIVVACIIGIISLLISSPAANSTVITFEDLYPGYEAQGQLPAGYGGFTWSPEASWITSNLYPPGDTWEGYHYGAIGNVVLGTVDYNYDPPSVIEASVTMTRTTPFDFKGASITAAWIGDDTVDYSVEGWRGGTLVYSQRITTHNDAPYWFDFNFTNVDTIVFVDLPGPIAIDNISYNERVPEPSTLLLSVAGLAGIPLIRKRLKTKK